MKPTITRVGDKITRIRFKDEGNHYPKYAAIINAMPDDKSKRDWLSHGIVLEAADGWVEVRPV